MFQFVFGRNEAHVDDSDDECRDGDDKGEDEAVEESCSLTELHGACALLECGGVIWRDSECRICRDNARNDGADCEIWRGRFIR